MSFESEQKEYFVVKSDKGLYYRGKGVNRWGKHFNQASIYKREKEAENTVKELSWHGEKGEVTSIEIREISRLATDTVEVVRCKDCTYCGHFTDGHLECRLLVDLKKVPMTYRRTHDNDFCSYGERKEK